MRKRKISAPITTTTDPGITTTCNCTAPMKQNICYIASVAQEITGSYPYSYPYLSSMPLADTTDRFNNEELSQTNQGMIVATAGNNGEVPSGGNVTMKR